MSPIERRSVVAPKRIIGLAALIGVVFVVYLVHLFQMQVLDGYIYLNRARQTALRSEPVFAQRGQIFDTDMEQLLATNRNSFAITIVPGEVPRGELSATVSQIAAIIDGDEGAMLERLSRRRGGSFEAVEIVAGLSLEELTVVAERVERFPGVSWYSKPERAYPAAEITSHVVGYVGEITPQELQVLFNEGYSAASVLGKSGIEQRYDQLLRGENGRRFRTVDARGRRVGEEEELISPEQGQNLVLTIDYDLQVLAQEALGPRVGSVVALRPGTGEVLAMVNYPRFDPQQFSGPQGQESFRNLALDARSPFLNRAIQSVAAPASTFKIVMTTAILAEDAFPPEEEINCTGQFDYGNRVFNDWLEQGHGPLSLAGALAQSCNVYYWTMGANHLSVDQIIDYSARLGLGQPTGVDLPGEVRGLVPSPAWKEQSLNARWVGGDTVNMSIGEGYLQVTPLQMANLVATVVNDGRTYRPYVLKEVRDPVTGEVLQRTEPEIVRDAAISSETLQAVRSAMRGVISEGTANVVITTDAVESAGKTGTGQVGSDTNWTSWFVAYAPYGANNSDDQLVVAVMVDASNEWEWWAPKAANIILHGYFEELTFDEAVVDLRSGPRPLWYM
ncbi:MAG TPA: penicillin-binding protein 2 [Alkalispirochaeta sp.]|nr:penicillin-binding protein 2 [Alkalispirochaeta sp.]